MPTLQRTDITPASGAAKRQPRACPIEGSLGRIAPMLMRSAVETSSAFLRVPGALGSEREAPHFSIPEAMHCSQMNMGDRHQFLFNLSVEKAQWDSLFSGDMTDCIKLDAYCELANCICGSIMADDAFTDEFGYMIPCVPCNGASRPAGDARIAGGSMMLGGAWIRFTFAIRETDAA